MVAEEGLPSLIGAPSSRTIRSDGGIRDADAQFGQFGLDALAATGGIAGPHSTNQGDEFAVNGGSAAAATRLPAPEQAKPLAMTSDWGLTLKEHHGSPPVWSQSPECEPEQPISMAESGFAGPSSEHSELMPKRQIFEQKQAPGLEAGKQENARKRKRQQS
jgi:hypothetical protein